MEKYILAHDLGTTGDKATLVDIDGYMKATAFQGYATHYPNNGWAEQDAWDYWKAFCKANKRLFEICRHLTLPQRYSGLRRMSREYIKGPISLSMLRILLF